TTLEKAKGIFFLTVVTFNRSTVFAPPRSGLCHQRDQLLSPATLSLQRPFVLARLRLFRQLFRARPSKFHRRSSAAANTRSRSRAPLSPFPPVPSGRKRRKRSSRS